MSRYYPKLLKKCNKNIKFRIISGAFEGEECYYAHTDEKGRVHVLLPGFKSFHIFLKSDLEEVKQLEITEKLLELGFELKKNYYGNKAYVYRTPRVKGLRFVHDFVYYEYKNQFYINCHKTRHTETITEDALIRDHNGVNTPAKDKWLEIKEELKDYEFNIFSWR